MSDKNYELLDLEIDELFREAVKPYRYYELIRMAKDRELDKKCHAAVIARKIRARLDDEIYKKARLINGVS